MATTTQYKLYKHKMEMNIGNTFSLKDEYLISSETI